ncbi:MAG: PAS domain S-box protein [Deltaproteobacteria bacterium]|nr:PAS domain S-box protein [Deltaproteobacteria bacterium]
MHGRDRPRVLGVGQRTFEYDEGKDPFSPPASNEPQKSFSEERLAGAQELFELIFETAPEAGVISRLSDGMIVEVNERFISRTGYLRSEVIGKTSTDLKLYEDDASRQQIVAELRRNGFCESMETVFRAKNGAAITGILSSQVITLQGVQYVYSIIRNITKQKLAEREVLRSRRDWENIFNAIGHLTLVLDKDHNIIIANRAAAQIAGCSPQDLAGKKCHEVYHGSSTPPAGCPLSDMSTTFRIKTAEMEMQTPHGTFLVSCTPVFDDAGILEKIIHIAFDITDRKRAESLLSIQHNLALALNTTSSIETGLQLCLDAALGASGMDCGGISLVNEADNSFALTVHKEMSDMPPDGYLGGDRLRAVAAIPVMYEGRVISIFNLGSHTRDDVSVSTRNALETIAAQIGTSIARLKTEEALRQSNEKFAKIFKTSPDSIAITRFSDGRYLEINERFTDTTGYSKEEVLGRSSMPGGVALWNRAEDRERLIAALREHGKIFGLEAPLRMKDGSIKVALLSARLLDIDGEECIISIARDITDRKLAEEEHIRLEQQLQQSQKMESLGVLAGGIAHDFNNLLAGIFGYIDLARSEPNEAQAKEYLNATLNTIDRAKGLTQQLLTFAKGGAPVQKIGALAPLIRDAAKFALSGSNVSCRFDIREDLWQCKYDKSQIGQVIDNMIINAQQAMPMGGTVEVSAGNVSVKSREHAKLAEGRYVKIMIADHGVGIPKEILPRIFEPFFTTKTKGHGLGLATCYSIINRHEGMIEVESEQGNGSTFAIYLPASEEDGLSSMEGKDTPHRGNGTIIVMDDEEYIRGTFGAMLQTMGYSVVLKKEGKEVLDYAFKEETSAPPIVGYFLDLTIPGGMGGKDIISRIREKQPVVPVFVASGYADDPVMANPVEYGFTASICKPFRIAEMRELLNKHIGKQGG